MLKPICLINFDKMVREKRTLFFLVVREWVVKINCEKEEKVNNHSLGWAGTGFEGNPHHDKKE